MENGMTKADLLRLVGLMGVAVGVAWAIQVLGFTPEGTAVTRMMWVMAAASFSGAGVGLVVTAESLAGDESNAVKA